MDDEDFEGPLPARKFQRIDVALLGLNLISEVFTVVANTFESGAMLLAAHTNYNVERAQFHDDAMLEIETLTGEEE